MDDEKIKLSILWISHFLIWTFGDMLRIIQPGPHEEIDDPIFSYIAGALAGLQIMMILISIFLQQSKVKLLNMIFGALYLLINISFLFEVISLGHYWEIELILIYFVINILTLRVAYYWNNK
ncbi:MAG: hypothetical protein INQ03_10995 [Candidatus Heimdallarchaeota archaeon]|nr:hypothetical protein [Candidatus Heimdallarchaeota archaeon]